MPVVSNVQLVRVSICPESPSWSHAADVMYMRETHRIVGAPIGSLPTHGHQNVFLGLPVLLMPEELTLLLSLGMLVHSALCFVSCFAPQTPQSLLAQITPLPAPCLAMTTFMYG